MNVRPIPAAWLIMQGQPPSAVHLAQKSKKIDPQPLTTPSGGQILNRE